MEDARILKVANGYIVHPECPVDRHGSAPLETTYVFENFDNMSHFLQGKFESYPEGEKK